MTEKTCANCRHWFQGSHKPDHEGECYALKSAPVTRADYTCELWKMQRTTEEVAKLTKGMFS